MYEVQGSRGTEEKRLVRTAKVGFKTQVKTVEPGWGGCARGKSHGNLTCGSYCAKKKEKVQRESWERKEGRST